MAFLGLAIAKIGQRKLHNNPNIKSFLQEFERIKNEPVLSESLKNDPDFRKAEKLEKFLTGSIFKDGIKNFPKFFGYALANMIGGESPATGIV